MRCRPSHPGLERFTSTVVAARAGIRASARRTEPSLVVAPVTKFLKLLEHRHVKPWLRSLEPWQRVKYGDVRVHYQRHLDGGGSSFGQDYIPFFLDRGMP